MPIVLLNHFNVNSYDMCTDEAEWQTSFFPVKVIMLLVKPMGHDSYSNDITPEPPIMQISRTCNIFTELWTNSE